MPEMQQRQEIRHSPPGQDFAPTADSRFQQAGGNALAQQRLGGGSADEPSMLLDDVKRDERDNKGGGGGPRGGAGGGDDGGDGDVLSEGADVVGKENVAEEAPASSISPGDLVGGLDAPAAEGASLEAEARSVIAAIDVKSVGGGDGGGGGGVESSDAMPDPGELMSAAESLSSGVLAEQGKYGADEQALAAATEGPEESKDKELVIQGSTAAQLNAMSITEKRAFLEEVGVPAKDLKKAKESDLSATFADVIAKSSIPGTHKVRLKIKGGLFKKSYDIVLNVTEKGQLQDIEAKKNGSFMSKLGGVLKSVAKMALPVVAKLLAPMTGGLSLIALGIYDAAMAIKNKDWLGAIASAAGGIGGIGAIKDAAKHVSAGLLKASVVAQKIANVALAAKAGLAAFKARSPGALLAALASGASAVASFAANQTGNFAKTLEKWSDRLEKWANGVQGGEGLIKAVQGKDPLEAFESAMSLAGDFTKNGRVKDAAKITTNAKAVKDAIDGKDPDAIARAMLGLASAIHETKKSDEKDADGKSPREEIKKKYDTAKVVAGSSIGLVRAVKSGNWEDAVKSAAGLVEELSKNDLVDSAARITKHSAELTKAIRSGDPAAIAAAALALGKETQDVWKDVKSARAKAGLSAEAPPIVAGAEEAELEQPIPMLPITPFDPSVLPPGVLPTVPGVEGEDSETEEPGKATGPAPAKPSTPAKPKKPTLVWDARVHTAQSYLNLWSERFSMGIRLEVDGLLGQATVDAIRTFQSSYPPLKPTGQLDPATYRKLQEMDVAIQTTGAAEFAARGKRADLVKEANALVKEAREFITRALGVPGFPKWFVTLLKHEATNEVDELARLAAMPGSDAALVKALGVVKVRLPKIKERFEKEVADNDMTFRVVEAVGKGATWTINTFAPPPLRALYGALVSGIPAMMAEKDWGRAITRGLTEGALRAIGALIPGGATGFASIAREAATKAAVKAAGDATSEIGKLPVTEDRALFRRQAMEVIKKHASLAAADAVYKISTSGPRQIELPSAVHNTIKNIVEGLVDDIVNDKILEPLIKAM